MRTSKKSSKANVEADASFERLYRTIPNQSYAQRTDKSDELTDSPPEKPKWRKILKRISIVLLIVALLTGLWLGWKLVANGVKLFGWSSLTDIFRNTKLQGEDTGRVNILLAGNSADDPGHGGADLTDSIMVASINTKDKTGYIVSIPRDLYVNIPDSGYAKINEAYQDGKSMKFSESGYAEGGMGLLEKTVETYFGMELHYYALVNYTALEQAVTAVGGIEVTIASTDPRGLYDSSLDLKYRTPLVKLPNGAVALDGRAALNLARARGNGKGSYGYGMSDFMRTDNQRKVLLGIKEKATSAGTLTNPIKVGQLLDSLGNNVTTDFKAGEVKRLAQLTKDIPSSQIKSVSLSNANGKNLLTSYTTKSRQSALVPVAGVDDYSEIKAFISGL